MKKIFTLAMGALLCGGMALAQQPKIYIAFQWHMHQPIYTPGETVIETYNKGTLSYNLLDVFTSRTGAYTTWPSNAVKKLISAGLPGGAQVSFSGSLVENLNVLEAQGVAFKDWKKSWIDISGQTTPLGNPRLDMVAFGYYHPLMALIDGDDACRQIKKHKQCFAENFPGMKYSKGMFPPENAFEEHLIPSLVKEGIKWVMVDNSHFDRASVGQPWVKDFSIVEPNKADRLNADPDDWVKLTDLYAPGKISAGWGHRPHWIKYVNPDDGVEYRMIAVPTSLLFGNEDGRGGFGALQYEKCLSQLEPYNNDAQHPILVVLHHDGDNHGGGSESYYGSNFQNFVNWLKANPSRFECTTIEDYLAQFPPADDDIIHVEPGSWYGAGADPEFLKWNGDEGSYAGAKEPYSPDHNSWGIITAASNIVKTAEQISPNSAVTAKAWDYLMTGETSCYWYWDGTEEWDSKPATAANLAVGLVKDVLPGGDDHTAPSIYHPQREPYNPGATEWMIAQNSDFKVWTYVYDVSGLKSVKLKYRIDKDGENPLSSNQNETYAGGDEVGDWQEIDMTARQIESITNPKPLYKADEYSAMVTGLKNVLVDYYVEAVDNKGNVARSMILHVWVGSSSVTPGGGGSGDVVTTLGSYKVSPEKPSINDVITITADDGAEGMILHWGINKWEKPIAAYLPAGSVYHTDGIAARTPFSKNSEGKYEAKIGPFNNSAQPVKYISFVTNTGSSWDNNGGADYQLELSQSGVEELRNNTTLSLYAYSCDDKVIVRFPDADTEYRVEVMNLSGAVVGSCAMDSGNPQLPCDLGAGVYLLRATDKNTGLGSVVKFIVR